MQRRGERIRRSEGQWGHRRGAGCDFRATGIPADAAIESFSWKARLYTVPIFSLWMIRDDQGKAVAWIGNFQSV
jgi:hypothetical protein